MIALTRSRFRENGGSQQNPLSGHTDMRANSGMTGKILRINKAGFLKSENLKSENTLDKYFCPVLVSRKLALT